MLWVTRQRLTPWSRFIETVLLLQPSFGGVTLEDISQPKCFRILDALRAWA
ncbi:MAG: hypothetical protein WA040_17725 [Anaerolineae bacterium]